ncbi:MAG TPA: SirB2 family protein [Opitutaceae bacterium]|nr:SirB2 family protein [Opitutaceae bacterium]
MDPNYYSILHVFSLFVLTAHTFMAFANPRPEDRRQTLIITGVASLLVLVSGFGMVARIYQHHIFGWMVVKMVCWLLFSALAGIAYRRPHLRGKLAAGGLTLLLIALAMVYLKPTF